MRAEGGVTNMTLALNLLMPVMLAGISLYAMCKRVDVYDGVIHGAAEGLSVIYRIAPPLIALMTAIAMLRASGALELAAQALGCEPCRIAKSLSFLVDGHAVLVVAAGDTKVDNPRYKTQFGTKAKMLAPEEAETLVGHRVGGVCPFAVNEGVSVYLDQSLKRFDAVFPACGSGNSAIELSIPELERYSGFSAWVDVCKGRQEA